jgi:SNF2 family DNA or RNA helicase
VTRPPPKLHPYQNVAVDHLHRNDAAGLLLDMGLGKTAVTLSALTTDHLPALVIAPKRVVENVWPTEARIWRPDLKVRVASGRKDNRLFQLGAAADVTVISRDNFASALNYPGRWNTVVFDELSSWKSPKSLRFRTAKKLIRGIQYRVGLTGTPSPNGYLDLWSQVYLLDEGERLGKTFTGYKNRYFAAGRQLPNGVVIEWNLRPGAKERIDALIEDICLAMSSDGRIKLPKVTYNTVTVPLPSAARSAYKKLKDDLVLDLTMLGGEVHTAASAAMLSSRLCQISAGFIYVDDREIRDNSYTELHKEKISAVREIVDGTGSPVLVFYRFRAELEMLKRAFPDEARTIDEPDVIAAWNNGYVPVLLAHPASAGHGLNLQHGGHTIVWTSLPWSLEEWEQANARLARQGQTEPVVIHILSAPHTVDSEVRDALLRKTSVQDALLRHLESPL